MSRTDPHRTARAAVLRPLVLRRRQRQCECAINTAAHRQSGVLPGQDALPFLVSSNLPQQALGEIWAIADPDNNGFLTRDGWYKAARLIGWLQKGNKTNVDESLLSQGMLVGFV